MKWQISHQPFLFSKLFHGINRTPQLHLKTPFCDSWDIKVKVPCSFKALSCTTLLPGLGACIYAWQFFRCSHLHLAPFLESWIVIQLHNWLSKIWKESSAWFYQAIWLNLFLLLLSCIVNLSSESASQGEGCCIKVRDQCSSWGSTVALNCFLPQKIVM